MTKIASDAGAGPVDIAAFLPVNETIIDILTPDGKPIGWEWTLAPTSHSKAVAFSNETAKRNLHRAAMQEAAQVNNRKYHAEEKSPDEARRDNLGWVVARVLNWTPIKLGGESFEFSDRNTENLLIRPELGFVLTQVTDALNADRLFMQPSGTT